MLDLRLVVIVRDEVFRVEIRLLRERREEGEVWGVGRGAHVVDDYVEHEVHASGVQRATKVLEVVGSSEMRVERVEVLSPVSVELRESTCPIRVAISLTRGMGLRNQ